MSQWVVKIGKVFGFLPFTIVHEERMKKIYLTPWNCIWMLVSIIIYGLCIYIVYSEDSTNMPYSMLQVLIVKMANMSGGAVAIFGICMDFLNRHQIWCMVRTFNEFDEQVCVSEHFAIIIHIIMNFIYIHI